MVFDPKLHHRRSLRLREYDYSQAGGYFVTLCTRARQCLFGKMVDFEMRLNQAGEIANNAWMTLSERYPNVLLDEYVIMPNHLHGIITIVGAAVHPAPLAGDDVNIAPTKKITLGVIIAAFKSISAMNINTLLGTRGSPLWQRNYYEHIIRDEADLLEIRQYILNNPARWHLDKENPLRIS